jgi:hypothetical protein
VKQWLEIIRNAEYFNLLVQNQQSKDTDFLISLGTKPSAIMVQFDNAYEVSNNRFDGCPDSIITNDSVSAYVSDDSTSDNIIPHGYDPAPSQQAGAIAFQWSSPNGEVPYRDDGFPALVTAVNLTKHYDHGTLHRKGPHPAIKAKYLAAIWYDNYRTPDVPSRTNGPECILFHNYKEFWKHGKFIGHRWASVSMRWKCGEQDKFDSFMKTLKEPVDMFGNVFFTEPMDEICFVTDFN